ncbi:hypothetical protein Tco_0265189 [Tanacetum coccineum]
MASTFGSKSISFMTMSILPQDEPLTNRPVIGSGPHDTQYCMENLDQAFVDYASSRIDEARGLVFNFMASQNARLSKFEADFKQQQSKMTNKIDTVLKAVTERIAGELPSDTVHILKLNANPTSSVLSSCSYPTEDPQCSAQIHGSINTIMIVPKRPDKSQTGKLEEEEQDEKDSLENINTNPSSPPGPSVSFITKKVCKLNLFFELLSLVPQSSDIEFVCTKGDASDVMFIKIIKKNVDSHKEEPEVGKNTRVGELVVEYFDVFPTRSELAYHRKLDPRENINGQVNNFTGRIKGMHVFVGNFTYVIDFIIVEDISSIIDPRLSQVVLGKPFVEVSNITHDPPEGVVRFTNGTEKIAYKMPYKIEQYNSLSDIKREHTKSVYLRNKEDKRRGMEYLMSKILGFYKECLELGPEYATGIADEGEVTSVGTGYSLKDKIEVKPDKTEHRIGKSAKN